MSRDTLEYHFDGLFSTAGPLVADVMDSCRLTDIGELTREQLGQLLAAAPELLIAAKAHQAWMARETFKVGDTDEAERICKLFTRAIAKAEGKET